MIGNIFLAAIAAALAAPAFAQVPPPIRVTAKGKEVVPVLVSQPLPGGRAGAFNAGASGLPWRRQRGERGDPFGRPGL